MWPIVCLVYFNLYLERLISDEVILVLIVVSNFSRWHDVIGCVQISECHGKTWRYLGYVDRLFRLTINILLPLHSLVTLDSVGNGGSILIGTGRELDVER